MDTIKFKNLTNWNNKKICMENSRKNPSIRILLMFQSQTSTESGIWSLRTWKCKEPKRKNMELNDIFCISKLIKLLKWII
jgi:hypothetical protein